MSNNNKHKEHLKGRRAEEVPSRPWPMVSRKALSDLQLGGEAVVPEDWNTLVHSLAAGYVHLHNADLWLRKAWRELRINEEKFELLQQILRCAADLEVLKAKWPLTILPEREKPQPAAK